jgi:heme-degrading monooxygenase HmoA
MAQIQTGTPILTFINVFTVAPDQQQTLLDHLIAVDQEVMRHLPGYISVSFHRSLDGRKVVNYAQWKSSGDFEAMLRHPAVIHHLQEARRLAEQVEPGRYEVVYSETRSEALPER